MTNSKTSPVSIVTGGASGIGLATVQFFAEKGSTVIAVDKDIKIANETETLQNNGFKVEFLQADLTSEDDCKFIVNHTVNRHGTIDNFVHNVGAFRRHLLHEATNEEFSTLIDVNVKSVFWMCKYVLPHMLDQGYGNICITASKTGLVAQYDSPLYCASKAAVVRLVQAIALDYASFGIRANAICPGIIDTPMLAYSISQAEDPEAFLNWNQAAQPLGRLGTPEECAKAAYFLCSPASSFITGVCLPVDGGFTAM